jgi:N-methylhydantoinase A
MQYKRLDIFDGQMMAEPVDIKVGIEIGGTFTDCMLVDDNGVAHIEKVLSTPNDLTQGAVGGLESLLQTNNCHASSVSELLHGSTIATNAFIERKGDSLGVLTTAGFEDVLIIGRQERDDVNDMFYQRVSPLVRRRDIKGVQERVTHTGQVLEPLNETQALQAIRILTEDLGHSSIAICLLHAYANADHETQLADLIRQHYPQVEISLSSDVCPEHREYERASTTVLSAYVRPIVSEYLGELGERLTNVGFSGTPLIMQSTGGVLPVRSALEKPAHMYLSGPAAGVSGAVYLSKICQIPNLITMDVGGTSCDVSLIDQHTPQLTVRGTSEFRIHGFPLNLVMMDIFALGAGGGSIAHEDAGGMLQVGPQSAGASPGPACYGRGGEAFTLTDALLLLGLLDSKQFAGGSVALDSEQSVLAAQVLCERYAMAPVELANSVLQIATANVAQGLRLSTVQRGHDPRDYTLCAYGGAGPLVAAFVAEALSIGRVVVPPLPGVFSAFGLCVADMRMDFVRALPGLLLSEATLSTVTLAMAALDEEARNAYSAIDVCAGKLEKAYTVDARYAGQGYEIRVGIDSDAIATDGPRHIESEVHEQHQRHYGHCFPDRLIEIVNVRIACVYRRPHTLAGVVKRVVEDYPRTATVALRESSGQWPITQRAALTEGWKSTGPLLIVEDTSTTVVPPRWQARLGASECLLLEQVSTDET